MGSLFEDAYERFRGLHQQMIEILNELPREAYDWRPAEGTNSIAVLVTHICGSERFWIGDGALGEPSGRDRDAEFTVANLSREELVSKLTSTLQFIHDSLQSLATQDLGAPRFSPRDGKEMTLGWAIIYTLEHSALHVGHIQLTRQLWEQQVDQMLYE